MKITPSSLRVRQGIRAMTLAEMMTSMAIFSLVFGGLLAANMFGLQQDELTNSKLGANDQARNTFSLIMDEIRSSKNVQIGSGNYSTFAPLTNGQVQEGPSLQIIPSTNNGMYIYYWFDTNYGTLSRASYSNGLLSSNMVAQYLTNMTSQWNTNAMVFRAYDWTGTNLLTVDPTNYTFNYVVSMLLQFYQYQYPQTMVGSNQLFDYYQLTFSATRRSP